MTHDELEVELADWAHGVIASRLAAGDPAVLALVERAEREQGDGQRRPVDAQ